MYTLCIYNCKNTVGNYDFCYGNAHSGAFLGNVRRVINDSADQDASINVYNNCVHSDEQYVDHNSMQVDNAFSVNAIQIVGDKDDYSYMLTDCLVHQTTTVSILVSSPTVNR